MPRCPNGTRKNKSGNCVPKNEKPAVEEKPVVAEKTAAAKRCPKGTRKNRKTGDCEPSNAKPKAEPKSTLVFTEDAHSKEYDHVYFLTFTFKDKLITNYEDHIDVVIEDEILDSYDSWEYINKYILDYLFPPYKVKDTR